MRYSIELSIALPRERVVGLFLDPRTLQSWQPGLVSVTPIGAEVSRTVGARTRQIHQVGKRQVEIIETVTAQSLPEMFSATYETDGAWNLLENRFTAVNENETLWTLVSEYKCSGLMRLMTVLAPGACKRQTLAYMRQFKDFAKATDPGDGHGGGNAPA